ncbi:uncharacterized protein LOC114279915 [Camellia sinensis]|uniref:uncharacterized protein LOC114279915 n=1 Tax=Camellia sinensis TaxID=4442 RepID=UPI00103561D8|nr:uncharacterized protein LOC114279915 [Camellia sinensis]
MASFTEAELLKGLCSAQMEATALAGALLRKVAASKGKVGPLKVKLEEAKVQLESLRRKTAGWKKTVRSVCSRGLEEAQKAKKMEVLAMVQGYSADQANAEMLATKLIRFLVDSYNNPIPAILEIPSKDHPYDPTHDSVLSRVKYLFSAESVASGRR